MNYKPLISRLTTIFAIMFVTAAHAQAAIPPIALAAIKLGTISLVVSFIIAVILFYVVMKIAQKRWGALQASLILFGSYFLSARMTVPFIRPVTPFPFEKFILGVVIVPILIQIGAWFLLFKKQGWATVLLLCGISILFPVLFVSMGGLLKLFGVVSVINQ